ncbi:MAG: acyl-CoA dehydrogenase family protein [Pseudomonadales bacterium]|nr:acyl-CoA dehydrogenase family protein [Pseudomonadales bacterium]MBO6657225.1 acyl-CoA dehydrogenase family protein [Pseudomonadales bacterium]
MSATLDSFREETRAWLEANCPPGARGPGQTPVGSRSQPMDTDTRHWLERMADKGWTVPTWPREYGGAELNNREYKVLVDELKRINARTPLTGRGVNYIGPTILEFGTDEQKARWLPICARGEGAWAMGYSEPGAGSDLASLSTRAVREGDNYIINGRKTWTSDATHCDYIFVLVRTSPDKPKHEGISLVLVDMHQEGVSVSPIPLLSGASPFCETIFEDAIAPVNDVIGGVDRGWTVGKRLLQFERSTHAGINISGSQGGRTEESRLPELVMKYAGTDDGRIADPVMRTRLTRHEMNTRAQQITQRRAIAELQSRAPGFTSSAVKLTNALNIQTGDEILMDAMGTQGYRWDTKSGALEEEVSSLKKWLYQKSLTIAGGTKEVQLNIIAKRVLGLPD